MSSSSAERSPEHTPVIPAVRSRTVANSTVRGPGVASPGRRSMAAAARAAARRTERVGPEAATAAPDETVASDKTGPKAPDAIKPEAPDDASQAQRPDDQQAGPVLCADEAVSVAARGRRRGRICAVLAVLVAAMLVA